MSDQEKNASTNSPVGSNQSDLGEDLSDVSASESELVGDDTKSLKFGQTLMDDKELDCMVTNRMVERGSVRLPGNEVIPDPKSYECVVFGDQFASRLRMPCQEFLEELLKAYNIEMHHLTPNGIAKIALFIWAVKCQDVNLDIRAFVLFMRCILSLGIRMWIGRLLSSTLVVVVLNLLMVLSKFLLHPRISGLKIGIGIGFTIWFQWLKKRMSQGRL